MNNRRKYTYEEAVINSDYHSTDNLAITFKDEDYVSPWADITCNPLEDEIKEIKANLRKKRNVRVRVKF